MDRNGPVIFVSTHLMKNFNMKNSKLTLVTIAASAALIAGCGAGSGGAAPAPNTTPTSTAPATAPTINSVVAAPTYATNSQQAVVYSLINAARVSCGSVSQSAALNQASQAHDYWMLANGYYGHGESSTVPTGYTGVTPYDRDVAAGYTFNVTDPLRNDEVITGDGSVGNLGATLVANLLAAPYHSAGVLRGFQNLGIGYMDSNAAWVFSTYGALTYLTVDFGVHGGSIEQYLSSSDVKTYPCEGTTEKWLRLSEQQTPNTKGLSTLR